MINLYLKSSTTDGITHGNYLQNERQKESCKLFMSTPSNYLKMLFRTDLHSKQFIFQNGKETQGIVQKLTENVLCSLDGNKIPLYIF